jgi:hypothetical protein
VKKVGRPPAPILLGCCGSRVQGSSVSALYGSVALRVGVFLGLFESSTFFLEALGGAEATLCIFLSNAVAYLLKCAKLLGAYARHPLFMTIAFESFCTAPLSHIPCFSFTFAPQLLHSVDSGLYFHETGLVGGRPRTHVQTDGLSQEIRSSTDQGTEGNEEILLFSYYTCLGGRGFSRGVFVWAGRKRVPWTITIECRGRFVRGSREESMFFTPEVGRD